MSVPGIENVPYSEIDIFVNKHVPLIFKSLTNEKPLHDVLSQHISLQVCAEHSGDDVSVHVPTVQLRSG